MGLAARALESEPAPWAERRSARFVADPAMNVRHIVFFQNDALPESILARMDREPESVRRAEVQAALDELQGEACLGQPWIANSIEKALKRADGRDYHLIAWRILPNHVHVLVQPGSAWPWGDPVDRWKRLSSPGGGRPLAPNLERFGPDRLRRRARPQYGRPDEFWAGEDFERILEAPGEVDMALHDMKVRVACYSRRRAEAPEPAGEVDSLAQSARAEAPPPQAAPPAPPLPEAGRAEPPPSEPPSSASPGCASPDPAPTQDSKPERPSAASPPWGSALTFPPRDDDARADVEGGAPKTTDPWLRLTGLLSALLIVGLAVYWLSRP